MEQAWRDAAHLYNSLDERGRAHYWSQLSPDQQELLKQALASVGEESARAAAMVAAPAAVPVVASVATPATVSAAAPRRSLGSVLAIGCTGMLLGAIFTVAAEVVAVSAGIQAVSGLFAIPGGATSREEAPKLRDEDFKDEDFSHMDCASLLKDHPSLYSQCMSRQNAEKQRIPQ